MPNKTVVKLEGHLERGKCFICGNIVRFQIKKGYSLREAKCPMCGGSKRSRDLAKAIVKTYLNNDYVSLAESIKLMKHLSAYEAQGSGPIHNYLCKLPKYTCSEYFDNVPLEFLHESGARCENLENLTFADKSFDLVITQDVLEHVANPEKAFLEIHRVLKPGGYHIFTVPFHEGKKTITRVKNEHGKENFLFSPVYHGDPLREKGALVYTDFGEDMLTYLESLGLPTEIVVYEKFYSSDVIPYITDGNSYQQYLKFKKPTQMLKYFLYNSIAFRSMRQKLDYELPQDGERFLPWMEDPIINYEHLHRYRFAREFVKGKKILDLACGEGYGSYMLAEEASEVIGVDVNESIIKHANGKYVKDNLKFIKGSMMEIPIEGEKEFDVIICFEALEHIEDQSKVIAEIKRMLKKDGIFIVSMPNKHIYSDQPNYKNPWHKKELYLDEFEVLLKSAFKNVLIYGQRVFPASNIFPISEVVKNTQELAIKKIGSEFSFVSLDKKEARYFIAVSSDDSIKNPIGSSYMVDISEDLFQKNLAFKNLQNELEVIHHSHVWKILSCYYKFRDETFPPNTIRRAYVNSLLKMVTKLIKLLSKGCDK